MRIGVQITSRAWQMNATSRAVPDRQFGQRNDRDADWGHAENPGLMGTHEVLGDPCVDRDDVLGTYWTRLIGRVKTRSEVGFKKAAD